MSHTLKFIGLVALVMGAGLYVPFGWLFAGTVVGAGLWKLTED